jgi:ABC-2 type transport system ATP-binding protein
MCQREPSSPSPGPNGTGETTTVNMLTTLLALDAGKVVVVGHDVATETEVMRAAIGVTGQFASAGARKRRL